MLPPLAIFNLGPWEIAFILLLALLLFGGKKLPSLAKDLGTGIREFKKSISNASEEQEPPLPQPPITQSKEEEIPKKKERKKTSA